MTILERSLAARFAPVLARREAELRDLLDIPAADSDAVRDVLDFKDIAVEDTLATIDEAKAEHARHELEQLLAARRRLKDGSYGECLDCGEAIDERRLMMLPATPYCTSCQAVHEGYRP